MEGNVQLDMVSTYGHYKKAVKAQAKLDRNERARLGREARNKAKVQIINLDD